MISISVVKPHSFAANRRSQAPACTNHSRQMVNHIAGAILFPARLGRSGALANNTERGTKQRAGKSVETLYRGSRKAGWLTGWRLIPVSGQEIDQGRHEQQNCFSVTANANAGIQVRDMEYSLIVRALSCLNLSRGSEVGQGRNRILASKIQEER